MSQTLPEDHVVMRHLKGRNYFFSTKPIVDTEKHDLGVIPDWDDLKSSKKFAKPTAEKVAAVHGGIAMPYAEAKTL